MKKEKRRERKEDAYKKTHLFLNKYYTSECKIIDRFIETSK